MNDFRIASYESYMNSHSTHEIEDEARNNSLLKKLTRNPRSLTARIAVTCLVISIILMVVIN
jgi:hypothetical protein